MLAAAYYGCRRYEDAISAAQSVLNSDRRNLDALLYLACSYVKLDRLVDARRAAEEALGVMPDFTLEWFRATHPYKESALLDELVGELRKAGLANQN